MDITNFDFYLLSLMNYFNLDNYKQGEPLKPTLEILYGGGLKKHTLVSDNMAINQELIKVYNDPVGQDVYEEFRTYTTVSRPI